MIDMVEGAKNKLTHVFPYVILVVIITLIVGVTIFTVKKLNQKSVQAENGNASSSQVLGDKESNSIASASEGLVATQGPSMPQKKESSIKSAEKPQQPPNDSLKPQSAGQSALQDSNNSSSNSNPPAVETYANYSFEIPSDLTPYPGQGQIGPKGSMTFEVTANWQGDERKVLLVGNYNGVEIKHMFAVWVYRDEMFWDTYDALQGKEVDQMAGGLPTDYYGKTLSIRLEWDFTSPDVPVKKMFINGVFEQGSDTGSPPSEFGGQVLIGDITNLTFNE